MKLRLTVIFCLTNFSWTNLSIKPKHLPLDVVEHSKLNLWEICFVNIVATLYAQKIASKIQTKYHKAEQKLIQNCFNESICLKIQILPTLVKYGMVLSLHMEIGDYPCSSIFRFNHMIELNTCSLLGDWREGAGLSPRYRTKILKSLKGLVFLRQTQRSRIHSFLKLSIS